MKCTEKAALLQGVIDELKPKWLAAEGDEREVLGTKINSLATQIEKLSAIAVVGIATIAELAELVSDVVEEVAEKPKPKLPQPTPKPETTTDTEKKVTKRGLKRIVSTD